MSDNGSEPYTAPALPELISVVDRAEAGPGLGADANQSEPLASGPF